MDDRLTVPDAAALLGISEGAVRKRIARGTLAHERSEGRVWVLLPPGSRRGAAGQDAGQPGGQDTGQQELVEELRDRVRFLERQIEEERESRRRADTIIAQLTQANASLARRVPELEAPREPRDGREAAFGEPERAEPRPAAEGPQNGSERRSPWWRRWLGG